MAINFNQIADDFKRTNWKNPGTWTMAPKIVVLLLVLAAIPVGGYFGVWAGQIEELDRGIAKKAVSRRITSPKRRRPSTWTCTSNSCGRSTPNSAPC